MQLVDRCSRRVAVGSAFCGRALGEGHLSRGCVLSHPRFLLVDEPGCDAFGGSRVIPSRREFRFSDAYSMGRGKGTRLVSWEGDGQALPAFGVVIQSGPRRDERWMLRPSCVVEEDLLQINLWLGAMETATNMHYDANHNLLYVLKGRKKVVLIPPNMTAKVHAMPVSGLRGLRSMGKAVWREGLGVLYVRGGVFLLGARDVGYAWVRWLWKHNSQS